MAHVGVERLGAGNGQEDAAQDDEAQQAVGQQELDAVLRHQGQQDDRIVEDVQQAQPAQRQEPHHGDRAEELGDLARALGLHEEQDHQDDGGDGDDAQLRDLADARRVAQALDRAQHRNGGRDDAVTVEQRGAADAEEEDAGRIFAERFLGQGHQGQRTAFALVVGAHQEDDVFHRHDHDQRPEDQRHDAIDGQRGIAAFVRMAQRLAHGVQRRRPDIAEDDADRADGQRPEAFGAMAMALHGLGFSSAGMGAMRTGRFGFRERFGTVRRSAGRCRGGRCRHGCRDIPVHAYFS